MQVASRGTGAMAANVKNAQEASVTDYQAQSFDTLENRNQAGDRQTSTSPPQRRLRSKGNLTIRKRSSKKQMRMLAERRAFLHDPSSFR